MVMDYEFFKSHMPQSDNLDLIVLKGHLLIEHCINQFIRHYFQDDSFFQERSFTFMVKFNIVRALVHPFNADVYNFVEKINELRNKIAHNLDYPGLTDKVDYLINHFGKDAHNAIDDSTRHEYLKYVFVFTCGSLAGALQEFLDAR